MAALEAGSLIQGASGADPAELAIGTANYKLFVNAGGTAAEWASGVYIGSFTRAKDGASGDVAYTSVGFKPSVVLFMQTDGSNSEMWSVGFDRAGTTRGYLAGINAAGIKLTGTIFSIRFVEAWPTKIQDGLIKTMDSDGFTITWTRTGDTAGGNMTVVFLALR